MRGIPSRAIAACGLWRSAMKLIEYRVRPVTRYIVTKYTADLAAASVETVGEFPNEDYAEMVADALDFANGTFRQRRKASQSVGGAAIAPATAEA